jgi:sirohydrochlorin ferrochelatase
MGADDHGPAPLPVRTTRYLRPGRHSSPHQLSLPSRAPALVLAVPGSASPESEELAAEIADSAGSSCPGATITAGYLAGEENRLTDILDGLPDGEGNRPPAVVIPLLTAPYPDMDAALSAAVTAAARPSLIAGHLGPHPFLAEAIHARLSEAGLARAARAARISVVTAADGVIVGAAGAQEALQAAGIVSVLLASRLAIPALPAPLGDLAALREAADRLGAAQVSQVALAPCVIGPELPAGALAGIAAETGLRCAPPLGAYPTIGQLVAIRYGAALEDPKLADVTG